MRITPEFRDLDIRKKLKDCQDVRIRVTKRGQSVYLHTHGDKKKIAACRVKPFELVNFDKDTLKIKEVMKEDGLENIDNLYTEDLCDHYYSKKPTHKIQYTATPKDPNKLKTCIKTLKHKHLQHLSIYHLKMLALTLLKFQFLSTENQK